MKNDTPTDRGGERRVWSPEREDKYGDKRWESMLGGSCTENWNIWREDIGVGGGEGGDGRMNQWERRREV